MKLSPNEQRFEDMLTAMRQAKIAPGYFMHVESFLAKAPPARWQAILRSIREHAPAIWFKH